MTYQPADIPAFGGLNLQGDPEEVGFGGAIDLLNIEIDQRGRLRQRDGYIKYTTVEAAARYDSIWPSVSGGMVAARAANIDGINSSGAVVASQAMTDQGASAVRFGSPTSSLVYVANTHAALKWDGTTWSSLSGSPKAKLVAVTATSNRLAYANTGASGGPAGASSSVHHVWFSDAGGPETFGANNYIQLTPGDSDEITSMVTWRDFLFVFKARRFFVFYGESEDNAGEPIFNYRMVDAGIGCPWNGNAHGQSAVAGTDAVYFANRRGIYRTSGGPPELISGVLDPIFLGGAPAAWQSGTLAATQAPVLAWHEQRLYVAIPTGASTYNNLLLVYDPAQSSWTAWNVPANSMASVSASDNAARPALRFAYGTGLKHIGTLGSGTTDDGTAIVSRYLSGFSDLGAPGREKTIRETEVTGIGTVQFSWASDFGSPGSTEVLTLGSSPATVTSMHRTAVDGNNLAFQLQDSGGGAWTVNSITPYVREVRQAGAVTA